MRGRSLQLLLLLLLSACGAAEPSCPALLAAAHLVEGYCAVGAGYCYADHEVPF